MAVCSRYRCCCLFHDRALLQLNTLYKIAFLGLTVMYALPSISQGCSTCRAQIITSNKEDFTVGNGLNTGILFLMIIPYIILFFLFRKQIVHLFKSLKAKT